jgi:hypothetical protein
MCAYASVSLLVCPAVFVFVFFLRMCSIVVNFQQMVGGVSDDLVSKITQQLYTPIRHCPGLYLSLLLPVFV